MAATALNTNEATIVDNGPFGSACATIEALVVAINLVEEGAAGHGKEGVLLRRRFRSGRR